MAVVVAAVSGAAVASPPVRAAPEEVVSRVTQLNRQALDAIDQRDFETAREVLKRALEACAAAGLDRHPIAARTRLHLGVVILEGFKNPELGRKQFAKALEIEPGITMTDGLSTPELEEAFADAKASGPSGTQRDEAGGPSGARPAISGGGLSYHTLSEVKRGHDILVTVTVEDSLKFRKIILAYRPQGQSGFLGRDMEPAGNGTYSAEIPARATAGASVAYYLEADGDDGQPLAERGSEERPLVIAFASPSGRPSSAHPEAVAAANANANADEDDAAEGGGGRDGGKRVFVGLLVGSGVGYVSGTGEVNADMRVAATVSGALLGQIAPEIGYWLAPDLMVSLQGRYQFVTETTEVDVNGHTFNPLHAALAGFAKLTWLTGNGTLRPFLSGGPGIGQIRHVVTFSTLRDCGSTRNQTCVDSVVAGPVLAEAGGGLMVQVTSQAALVLSSYAQIAEPKFTLNLDVNAGAAFNF